MEEKIEKIYKLMIVLIILVGVNLVVTFATRGTTNVESKTETTNETTESTNDYDVSMFDTVTLDELLKLFEDKKNNYVVYLGRSTCSACKTFLPTLQAAQKKLGYTTKYLDITTVDGKSDSYEKLMKYLNKEVTINISGEKETKPFGEFFGYTPMTFVIKKGKFSNGVIGAYTEDKFIEFLGKNGIK